LTLVSALRGAFLVQEERKENMKTPQVKPDWNTGIYIGDGVVAVKEKFEKRAKCRAGKYQVNHVGYMEYEVENIETGDTWKHFGGQRLTQLSHAFSCARWHHEQEDNQ
jgi:hypothetical protein